MNSKQEKEMWEKLHKQECMHKFKKEFGQIRTICIDCGREFI
jgi:predicted protein tyrosine phosphatase